MSDVMADAKAIFLEALDCKGPDELMRFLENACGSDAALRMRVEELMRAHRDAGAFLGGAERQDATCDQPIVERPGTVIGPYKLLQQIGEGGMGTVFMAEQTQPVQRKVALKVIKPGMDSRQVIARFEAERQALAMMDHVNIARVFDGGTTIGEPGGVSPGRPYFVMELVHGVPITKYCDDNHLTPRERLELFVPVCQAIQHAHQKGIIHRDIKPSNVMITLYDGKPVPKVIDFGVAKATEQKLTERTLFTQYGTMVGTLEYMSPEQAEMSALGADTRSDIYSLGVLLYELLTGSTPLTHKRIKEAAYGEILRMIKEEEPPRPSTRLSDSGEALASISAQRHMEPAKLTKLVRGELDWIVMKTLEKDRNRRYESASAFAADVQRYLRDEQVMACPPSLWYRLRKFARRSKGLVAAVLAASLVVLLAVIGLAVSNVLIGRERDQKAEALEQTRREKERSDRNLARAEANFQATLGAVDQMQMALLDDEELKKMRRARSPFRELWTPEDRLWEEVLNEAAAAQHRKALQIWQDFVEKDPSNPETRLERAWAYQRLGRLHEHRDDTRSVDVYYRAITLLEELAAESPDRPNRRRELAETYSSLAGPLGRPGGQPVASNLPTGKQARSRAITLYERLAADFPNDPQYRFALAHQYHHLACESGGMQKSEARRQMVTLYTKLIHDCPTNRDYRIRFINCLYVAAGILRGTTGSYLQVGGEEPLRQAIQVQKKLVEDLNLRQDILDLALDYQTMGEYLGSRGRIAEAETSYRQALALYDKLPSDAIPYGNGGRGGASLSRVCNRLGYLLEAAHRPQEAEKSFRRSVVFYESLPARDREIDVLNVKARDRAMGKEDNADAVLCDYFALGELLNRAGRFQEAEPVYCKALALQDKLAALEEKRWAGSRGHFRNRKLLANLHARRGDNLRAARQPQEAEKAYRQALELYQKHVKEDPDLEFMVREPRTKALLGLGTALKVSGRPDRAEQAYRQALESYRGLVAFSLRTWYLFSSGNIPRRSVTALGLAVPNLGGPAVPQAAVALRLVALGSTSVPDHPHNRVELYNLGYELGDQLSGLGKDSEAAEAYRGAISVGETVLCDFPDERRYATGLAVTRTNLGSVLERQNKYAEAETECRRAIRLDSDYASAHLVLGVVLHRQGKNAEAAVEFREAIRLEPGTTIAYQNLGLVLERLGKYSEAIDAYRAAIRVKPDWGLGYYLLGQALNAQGKWAEVIQAWGKLVELEPWHALRHKELAWLLATCPDPKFRDPPCAVALAKKAVGLEPKNGLYWQTLGVAQYRASDWKAAVAALEKVKELGSPGDSLEWFPLAMAHWQLGDKAQARQWYDRAVQWMEKNAAQNEELRQFRAEAEKLLELKK